MAQKDEHGGDVPVETATGTRYPGLGCSHCPAAFFSEDSHHAHNLERHQDKPHAEEWDSSENHKITYYPNFNRQTPHWYLMSDKSTGKFVSNMVVGHEGEVKGIETHPKYRRQGLATELMNAAHEHSQTTPGVPKPEFSNIVTSSGEKWQKSASKKLGGEIPKRSGSVLSPRQMMGMIDFSTQ